MTGAERMRAATVGEPVDRVPIWLREGFDFTAPPAREDNFSAGWQADSTYRSLLEFARPYCDMRVGWSPGGYFNRFLAVPATRIRQDAVHDDGQVRRVEGHIDTPKGKLTFVRETRRGVKTSWTLKYPVENLDDLAKLRSVPFEVPPPNYEGYERARERMGERGVLCMGLSSPAVIISGAMPFELFLSWSLAEKALFHELLEEITQRCLAALGVVLARPLDTIANIGGSEQCTPPMMSPEAYAEYVTPYDSRLVKALKEANIPVNCHCHGKVRRALREMVAAGFESTDPVEPPPAGDVTITEAREIVGDRLTLVGNLEFDELESATPDHIRRRVREIIDTGKRRLILGASAGPISRLGQRLAENYRAWIEEAVQYGRCESP